MAEQVFLPDGGITVRPTSSLTRGLAALERVAKSGKAGVTVTQVALELGLDKSSGSRILATLRDAGYVRQDVNRRYFSTARLNKLASHRPGVRDVAALSHDRLEELHSVHDEAIHLAVINGGEMLFLDYLQTTKPIRTEIPMVPTPVHEVAVGVAVLAALGHGERTEVMRESLTAASQRLEPKQRRELNRQIQLAQERGWATIEHGDEITRVAVAICEGSSPVGAISMSGPYYRIDPIVDEIAADMMVAAADITATLSA